MLPRCEPTRASKEWRATNHKVSMMSIYRTTENMTRTISTVRCRDDLNRPMPGGQVASRPLLSSRVCAIFVAGLTACGAAPLARAETNISPFAKVTVEHDSNVFMRPASSPPFASEGITALADTLQEYEAGMTSEFDWGAERLRLKGDAERIRYRRFSFLNRTEYKFHGDFDWRLSPVINGTVSYRQHHYLAPFTETLSTQAILDTERWAQATVRVFAAPEWRIDLTPQYHQFDSPLPGYRAFRLRERLGTAAVEYLGFGRFTAGMQLEYDQGRFAGIFGATRYDQRTALLKASYKVGGFSTFDGSVGYSVRDSEPNPSGSVPATGGIAGFVGSIGRTSGVMGSLTYDRQITAKTSAYLSLFRRLDSYAAGANPEIGTGGTVGIEWKPDVRFKVDIDYGLTREKIQGGLIVTGVTGVTTRNDYTRSGGISIRYAVLSWLVIRPYANWLRQTSTFRLGNYSSSTVGVQLISRLRW